MQTLPSFYKVRRWNIVESFDLLVSRFGPLTLIPERISKNLNIWSVRNYPLDHDQTKIVLEQMVVGATLQEDIGDALVADGCNLVMMYGAYGFSLAHTSHLLTASNF
jgi:hypothetical protein